MVYEPRVSGERVPMERWRGEDSYEEPFHGLELPYRSRPTAEILAEWDARFANATSGSVQDMNEGYVDDLTIDDDWGLGTGRDDSKWK
jgi:hypothetical protein